MNLLTNARPYSRKQVGRLLLSSCIATGLFGLSPAAIAQSDDDDNAFMLEEIVVTSRYKAESAQTVPVALTAFSEASLEKIVALDLRDIGPSVPNLSIRPVNQFTNSASIFVRGEGTGQIESTAEPRVGISIDGIFITRPVATLVDLFDVEAIEVLRGPQGTAFGKNSLAGGIAIRTKKPEYEFGATVEATIGKFGRKDLRGVINVPLIDDKVAFRLSALEQNYDGHFTNRVDDRSLGGENLFTARGSLLFTPNEDLEIVIRANLVRDRSDAGVGDLSASEPYQLIFGLYPYDIEAEAADGIYTVGRDFEDDHRTDQWGINANINYSADWGEITSITGYIKTDGLVASDFDQTEFLFFPTFRDQTHNQFSQEVRVRPDFSESDSLSNLDLTLGVFYMKQDHALSQTFPTLPGFNNLFDPTGPMLPDGSFPCFLGCYSADYTTQDSESWALFGQAIYSVSDRTNVTFGMRYTDETKDFFRTDTAIIEAWDVGFSPDPLSFDQLVRLDQLAADVAARGDTPLLLNGNPNLIGNNSDSQLTFKVGVDHALNDDTMVYAKYDQGFKAGEFGARSSSIATMGPTDASESESFEVGLKTDLADNRVRLNLAAFHTIYKGIEVNRFIPSDTAPSGQETIIQNAGRKKAQGFEAEFTWQATENLNLFLSGAYLNARYADLCIDTDGPAADTGSAPTSECGDVVQIIHPTSGDISYLVDTDESDDWRGKSRKWNGYVRGIYEIPLGDDNGFVSLIASAAYTGKPVVGAPAPLQTGARVLVDASINWDSDDGAYRLSLWGKNLTNQNYIRSVTFTSFFFNQTFYNEPFQWGLTARARF